MHRVQKLLQAFKAADSTGRSKKRKGPSCTEEASEHSPAWAASQHKRLSQGSKHDTLLQSVLRGSVVNQPAQETSEALPSIGPPQGVSEESAKASPRVSTDCPSAEA